MKRITNFGLGISLLALGSSLSLAQQSPAPALPNSAASAPKAVGEPLEAAPPAAAPAPTAPAAVGPKIQFATPIYEFGKIRSGEPVKHIFYFTNVGDATLEL